MPEDAPVQPLAPTPAPAPGVAVAYLARGFEPDHAARFARFAAAYRAHPAGAAHRLYVIFKGFPDAAGRAAGERAFDGLTFTAIDTADASYDLGAYADALPSMPEEVVCFLNTNTEVAAPNWLAKLLRNLDQPGVGIVGATGSYESLGNINPLFPAFPNPHLRSNAFALRRALAVEVLGAYAIANKLDAFFAESGPEGLTRRVLGLGLGCLVVGADGRGYPLRLWPGSETSRSGGQGNLLVHDNYTRGYEAAGALERGELAAAAWGQATRTTIFDGEAVPP